MKKTLAILLSCVLVVAAFFAVTMLTSAAEETYATSVQVTLADGSKVTLGAQSGDSVINYLTLNAEGMSGTMTFADGVLTLNNVSGLKRIYCDTGSLVLIVEGKDNVITGDGNNVIQVQDGNLTVAGTGTLNVTGKRYVFCSQKGNLEVQGNVNIIGTATEGEVFLAPVGYLKFGGSATVNASAPKRTIRTSGTDEGNIYFSDNANVQLKCTINSYDSNADKDTKKQWNAIESAKDLYVSGSATVTVTSPTAGQNLVIVEKGNVYVSGGSLSITAEAASRGLFTKELVVSGGKLEITGSYSRGDKNAISATSIFVAGGEIDVNLSATASNLVFGNVYVSAGVLSINGPGARAIDAGNKTFELSGGTVNIKGKYANDGGAVRAGSFTVSGGTFTYTFTGDSKYAIYDNATPADINIYGGTVELNGTYSGAPFGSNATTTLNMYNNAGTVKIGGVDYTSYTGTLGATLKTLTGTAPTPTAVPTGSAIPDTSTLPTFNATKNFTGTTTAAVGGNSVSTGNPYVTEKGVYWVAGNTMTVSKDIFAQVNASLSEDIALTYYVVPVTGATGVTFTVNNRPTTVTDYDVDAATGLYAYRFDGIAPQEMADNIAAVLEGTEYTKAEYSVKDYLTKLKTENASNDKMVDLIDNLLAYGGAAQTYLKMTDTISGDITGTAFDATGLSSVVDSEYKAGQNFKFTAATVYFDGVNSLAFQFTGDLTGKTVKLNGVETEYEIIQGSLVTPGIKATDFDKAYTVSVWDGATELASVTYSVNSYVYAKQSGSDISTLAQRTYMYGLAAEAYAGK